MVDASGIPSYDTARTVDTSAPAAPSDLRLRQGDLSGSLVARYQSSRARSMNVVQTTVGLKGIMGAWSDPAKIMVV